MQQLCEALVNAGHQVSVLTTRIGHAPRYETINGVRITRIKSRNLYTFGDKGGDKRNALSRLAWHIIDADNISMRPVVSKWLVDSRAEVLHTNNLAGISVAAWSAASALGVPVVHTVRDYYLLCSRSTLFRNGSNCASRCHACLALAWPKKRATANVAAVVGISSFVLNSHLHAGLFPRASVQAVIPNSVPLVDSRRERSSPLKDKSVTFGFLGQITEEKGIRWLLETFTKAEFPDSCLLRIGGALDSAYAQSLVHKFGNGGVAFEGLVDAQEFLKKVDVLVVPSLWNEPFGRVIIEANAQRVPVIATKVGGMGELVSDGSNGFLVEPDDTQSLMEAMHRFFVNLGLAQDMGETCAAIASQFANRSMAGQYCLVYDELAKRSAKIPRGKV